MWIYKTVRAISRFFFRSLDISNRELDSAKVCSTGREFNFLKAMLMTIGLSRIIE